MATEASKPFKFFLNSLGVFFLLLVGITMWGWNKPGPTTYSPAPPVHVPSLIDGSDAKFEILDWKTGQVKDTWEISNGFLGGVQMSRYSTPVSNCVGYQMPSSVSYPPGKIDVTTLCRAIKTAEIPGCDYNDNSQITYPVKQGEYYFAEDVGEKYCGAWIYHVRKIS